MEEWERRVAPGQSMEAFEDVPRRPKLTPREERKPSYRAGDGLPTLIA